jgi:hypothetical protein
MSDTERLNSGWTNMHLYYRLVAWVLMTIAIFTAVIATLILLIAILGRIAKADFVYPLVAYPVIGGIALASVTVAIMAQRWLRAHRDK